MGAEACIYGRHTFDEYETEQAKAAGKSYIEVLLTCFSDSFGYRSVMDLVKDNSKEIKEDDYLLTKQDATNILDVLNPVADYINLLSPRERILLQNDENYVENNQRISDIFYNCGGFEDYSSWHSFYQLLKFFISSELTELRVVDSY